MPFVLHLTIAIPYLKKEPWTDFSIVAIFAIAYNFLFCFRLNIFTNKISNLMLPSEMKGPGAVNLDIPNQ